MPSNNDGRDPARGQRDAMRDRLNRVADGENRQRRVPQNSLGNDGNAENLGDRPLVRLQNRSGFGAQRGQGPQGPQETQDAAEARRLIEVRRADAAAEDAHFSRGRAAEVVAETHAVEDEAVERIAHMTRQFDDANVHLRPPSYTRVDPAIMTPEEQRLLLGEELRNTQQDLLVANRERDTFRTENEGLKNQVAALMAQNEALQHKYVERGQTIESLQRVLTGMQQDRNSDRDDEYGSDPFEGEDLDALERGAQQHATAGRSTQSLNNRPRDRDSTQRDR